MWDDIASLKTTLGPNGAVALCFRDVFIHYYYTYHNVACHTPYQNLPKPLTGFDALIFLVFFLVGSSDGLTQAAQDPGQVQGMSGMRMHEND